MNRKWIILICVILIISFVFGLSFKPYIKLNIKGAREVSINYGDEYIDEGYDLLKCSLYGCKKIDEEVNIENNVNTKVVGSYEIKYTYENITSKRKVIVSEKVAPEIKLKGKKEINACLGHYYEDEGYTATDNYDGDITDKVEVKRENGNIYYKVSDSSNNTMEVVRKFTYEDNEKPTITLNGSGKIHLTVGDEYKEEGFIALDNCDGDLSNYVTVTGEVDTTKSGTYKLTYTVKDNLGNEASIEREVVVHDLNDENNINTYISSLEKYIQDKKYDVSIGFYNIENNYTYKYNGDVVYYGASLVKTLDALYVYEKMELTDELKSLVKPLIETSNNQAHMKLVKIIGINNIRNYGRNMGAKNLLTRGNDDYFGNTTIDDQLIFMKYLYNYINDNSIDESKRKELKNYFINDYSNYLVFDGIPTTMHKFGYFGVYYHESGIVFAKSPYIVVILTKEADDFEVVRDLSEKIYKLNSLV